MTYLLSYLEEAIAALWRNRVRSVLTMLGMIIGARRSLPSSASAGPRRAGLPEPSRRSAPGPHRRRDHRHRTIRHARNALPTTLPLLAAALGDRVERRANHRGSAPRKSLYGATNEHYSVATQDRFKTIPCDDRGTQDRRERRSLARRASLRLSQSSPTSFSRTRQSIGQELTINGARYTVVGVYRRHQGSSSAQRQLPARLYRHSRLDVSPRSQRASADNIEIYPLKGSNADALRDQIVSVLQHIHGPQAQYVVTDSAAHIGSFENVLNIIARRPSAPSAASRWSSPASAS